LVTGVFVIVDRVLIFASLSLNCNSVQVNAFPPSPKSAVDLYVSSNHGDSDTTITLRFPTYKTLDNSVPEVLVELVMG